MDFPTALAQLLRSLLPGLHDCQLQSAHSTGIHVCCCAALRLMIAVLRLVLVDGHHKRPVRPHQGQSRRLSTATAHVHCSSSAAPRGRTSSCRSRTSSTASRPTRASAAMVATQPPPTRGFSPTASPTGLSFYYVQSILIAASHAESPLSLWFSIYRRYDVMMYFPEISLPC